jgi:hypothetical protein
VAMTVGVVALTEHSAILLRGEIRIVIKVRGGKFSFAG